MKIYFYILLAIVALLVLGLVFGWNSCGKELKVGDKAPDFSLEDDMNKHRSLHEFLGGKIVLYFYPKDDTPGCTKEACTLRDRYSILKQHNITVLGVSYDSPASHSAFKAKHSLPFLLLSDTDKEVAFKYGAALRWFFVFTAPFAARKTFLIDEQGIIKAIISNVDVTKQPEEILKLFKVEELPAQTEKVQKAGSV